MRLLTWRGRIVLLAGARSRPVLPARELCMHDRSVVGFVISNATVADLAAAAAALNPRFAAGGLRPRRVEHRTLVDAAEAHRRLEDGEVRGRVVLLTAPQVSTSDTTGCPGAQSTLGITVDPGDHIRATP